MWGQEGGREGSDLAAGPLLAMLRDGRQRAGAERRARVDAQQELGERGDAREVQAGRRVRHGILRARRLEALLQPGGTREPNNKQGE